MTDLIIMQKEPMKLLKDFEKKYGIDKIEEYLRIQKKKRPMKNRKTIKCFKCLTKINDIKVGIKLAV